MSYLVFFFGLWSGWNLGSAWQKMVQRRECERAVSEFWRDRVLIRHVFKTEL